MAELLPVASSTKKGLNYGNQFYSFETNTTEIVIKYERKPGGGMLFDISYWLYNDDGEVIRVSVPSLRDSPIPVYAESLSGGKKILLTYRPTIYYGNDTIVIRPNSSGCITINNPFKSTTDMSYITSIKHNETRITDVSNLSEAEYL